MHEMSNPVFLENKKIFANLLSVELAQRVIKFKVMFFNILLQHKKQCRTLLTAAH